MVDQQISRHAGHPGGKAAVRRAIAAKGTVDPQEDFLRKILGLRAVTGKPVADVVDTTRMPAHKFLPGRPVALEALLDQLGILLQLWKSLETASWSIVPPPRLRLRVTAASGDTTSAAAVDPVHPWVAPWPAKQW